MEIMATYHILQQYSQTAYFLRLLIIGNLLEQGNTFLLGRIRGSFLTAVRNAAVDSFDFASPTEWDKFYKDKQTGDESTTSSIGLFSSSKETTATEWHSSIPLDDIASTVRADERCLVIGCGDSNLPDRILQREDPPRSLVLLDTSSLCLDQLRSRFDQNTNACRTQIEYVCGDATQLSTYFAGVDDDDGGGGGRVDENGIERDHDEEKKSLTSKSSFDIIIDKGLTDAILCGEGWDGPLEKLFHESSKILSMDTGRYLLISYQLPSSTKEFLVTTGEKFGLEWEFDYDLSSLSSSSLVPNQQKNQRVSVAMARKR